MLRTMMNSVFYDDLVVQSPENCNKEMSNARLNCQSLHAKFDYIQLVVDKFVNNNCALPVMYLQTSWCSSDTDLFLYIIPGCHNLHWALYFQAWQYLATI